MGGDEGTPATTSHRAVHRPVICDELQLVKPAPVRVQIENRIKEAFRKLHLCKAFPALPGAAPPLNYGDLGPGVQREGVGRTSSTSVVIAPDLAVLGPDGVHLGASPELDLSDEAVQMNLSPICPERTSVTWRKIYVEGYPEI